jgi:hypothetical protein
MFALSLYDFAYYIMYVSYDFAYDIRISELYDIKHDFVYEHAL